MARKPVETASSPAGASVGGIDVVDRPGGLSRPSWLVVLAAVAGLAAALTVAGSMGLMAHSLRRAVTLVFMASSALACRPGGVSPWRDRALIVGSLVVAGAMVSSALAVVGVMGVAVLLAGQALARRAADRRVLLWASLAVFVLGLYRLACTSSGTLWLLADRLGWAMGCFAWELSDLVGNPTGQGLWLGSTFAGVDLLVMSGTLFAFWIAAPVPMRKARIMWGAALIVTVHMLYLMLVTFGVDLQEALKAVVDFQAKLKADDQVRWWYFLGDLAGDVQTLLPWSLPAVGGLAHLLLSMLMLRRTVPPASEPAPEGDDTNQTGKNIGLLVAGGGLRWRGAWRYLAVLVVAAGVPLLAALTMGSISLKDKKIVLYEKCYGNWERPRHGDYGRLSIGMYGMLPAHLESLGAEWVVSRDLSDADLKDADALVVIYPHKPWKGEQLERIDRYVRNGGGMLVMGEHTTIGEDDPPAPGQPARDKADEEARFNDLLKSTAMRVRFDSGLAAVGGWLNSYEALAHPASAGVADDQNQFAAVTGASVETRWPARPILVGRWGWTEPGDNRDPEGNPSMMGDHHYGGGEKRTLLPPGKRRYVLFDAGWERRTDLNKDNPEVILPEKLGDVVLAAEQPVGEGRVVVFGDTSGISNGLMIDSYQYVYRLLGYLASKPGGPQAWWRQVLTVLLAVALVALVAWRGSGTLTVLAAVVVAGSLALTVNASHRAAEMLPDGRGLSLPDVPAEFKKLGDRKARSELGKLLDKKTGAELDELLGKRTRAEFDMLIESMTRAEIDELLDAKTRAELGKLLEPKTGSVSGGAPTTQPAKAGRSMLAYIDSTHMSAASEESWRDDGLMGLMLTLMRNGYLTLGLHEFTPERLERAGLLISVAPRREFTPAERKMVKTFVEKGGIFISTVGYEDRGPSEALLADFGLRVGLRDLSDGEPQPLGHYKSPYLNFRTHMAYARYHAGWEVTHTAGPARVITYARNLDGGRVKGDPKAIIMTNAVWDETAKKYVMRGETDDPRVGKVVLIGDTCFAMNKNLERVDGLPIEGMRENSDFWRWLLADLSGGPEWLPPPPPPPPKPAEGDTEGGGASDGAGDQGEKGKTVDGDGSGKTDNAGNADDTGGAANGSADGGEVTP